MFNKIKSLFSDGDNEDDQSTDNGYGLTLQVQTPNDRMPVLISKNATDSMIADTINQLSWRDGIYFVFLKYDEQNMMHLSGSLEDGLSGGYLENGTEYITQQAPGSLGELVRLMQSYAAGDNGWRSMFDWAEL